jgi:hypothetical protein
MKSGIAFTVIFLLTVAGGIWSQSYLNQSARELNAQASAIMDAVESESWDQAARDVSALDARWEEAKKWWLVLIEHEKIDMIDEAVHEAEVMIGMEEKPHSMDALGQFTFHVQDVPHKGRVGAANIF